MGALLLQKTNSRGYLEGSRMREHWHGTGGGKVLTPGISGPVSLALGSCVTLYRDLVAETGSSVAPLSRVICGHRFPHQTARRAMAGDPPPHTYILDSGSAPGPPFRTFSSARQGEGPQLSENASIWEPMCWVPAWVTRNSLPPLISLSLQHTHKSDVAEDKTEF